MSVPASQLDTYAIIAKHLKIPFDVEQNRHLDYDGAPYGKPLKQADVTLLGYPLQYQMSKQVRLNDLIYEMNFTNINGMPTMSSCSKFRTPRWSIK